MFPFDLRPSTCEALAFRLQARAGRGRCGSSMSGEGVGQVCSEGEALQALQQISPVLEVLHKLPHALLHQLLSVVSLCLHHLQLIVLLPVQPLQLLVLLRGAVGRWLNISHLEKEKSVLLGYVTGAPVCRSSLSKFSPLQLLILLRRAPGHCLNISHLHQQQ